MVEAVDQPPVVRPPLKFHHADMTRPAILDRSRSEELGECQSQRGKHKRVLPILLYMLVPWLQQLLVRLSPCRANGASFLADL